MSLCQSEAWCTPLDHSYESKFNLHVNKIAFSYMKGRAPTRFEKEAKGNLEMAE